MSLIPAPTQLTPVQRTAAQIRQQVGNLYAQMGNVYQQTYRAFWNDPQKVSDALGTDASDLFRLATILVTAVETAKPGTIPLAMQSPPTGYTVVINQDGTVNITPPSAASTTSKEGKTPENKK